MLRLKDLLEVIEEGMALIIVDWSSDKHNIIFSGVYHLEDLPKYNSYKVVTMEQNLFHIIINIFKVEGDY